MAGLQKGPASVFGMSLKGSQAERDVKHGEPQPGQLDVVVQDY